MLHRRLAVGKGERHHGFGALVTNPLRCGRVRTKRSPRPGTARGLASAPLATDGTPWIDPDQPDGVMRPPSRLLPNMAFTVWLVSEGEHPLEECEGCSGRRVRHPIGKRPQITDQSQYRAPRLLQFKRSS